jgi:hypothetical protein
MKGDFEYTTYSDDERLAILENRTVELLRRLEQVTPAAGAPGYHATDHGPIEVPSLSRSHANGGYADSGRGHPPDRGGAHRGGSSRYNGTRTADRPSSRRAAHPDAPAAGHPDRAAAGYADRADGYLDAPADAEEAAYPDHATAGHADRAQRYPHAASAGHPDRAAASHADRGGRHPEAPAAGYRDRAMADDADGADGYLDPRTADYPDAAGVGYAGHADPAAAGYADPAAAGYAETGCYPQAVPGGSGRRGGPGDRTEVLINRGRRHARRGARRWRVIAIITGAVAAGAALIAVVLPGGGGSWPASVATVQSEITMACQNANVVSEPSQVNFACAKDTRQILWVFSLLTSSDDPNYSDPSNGRKGLEPIQPAQGGNIAWSLNLHHPYNPANPVDSLEVAARAINNIIGGATVTGSNGTPVVQPGLESTAANCARYTGSPALITRQGFPPICALPVNTPDGQAALVTDVFKQWMVDAPSQYATEAGVLFENANNPGDPRVQSILNTLRISGL